MSGQQIGTVVGFVVGAYFGYPQLGAAIGGYIGGVIDPTQINGPHIGDGQNQSSADGVPIPWILGTAPCVGNICMSGPRYEVKQTDGGKGSTTETNTFESHQSFTILICESSVSRDSVVTGIQMVRQNGKIVYDVRPGSNMLAESAKWKEKVTFYFGAEDQMPDPTMEAIFGVGNTPANRGVCTAVFRDFNRSEFGDAIPQFEWVVVSAGDSAETVVHNYSPLQFGNDSFPWQENAPDLDDPRRSDVTYEYAFWPSGGAEPAVWYPSTTQPLLDAEAALGVAIGSPKLMGWCTTYYGAGTDGDQPIAPWDDVSLSAQDWRKRFTLGLIYARFPAAHEAAFVEITQAGGTNLQCATYVEAQWGAVLGGYSHSATFRNATVINATGAPAGNNSTWSCYEGATYSTNGLNIYTGYAIACRPVMSCGTGVDLSWTAAPDGPGLFVDDDGNVHSASTCSLTSGTFKQLQTFQRSVAAIDRLPLGPALDPTDPDYSNAAFWTSEYGAAVAAGDMAAGLVYGVDYPVVVSTACECANGLPPVPNGYLLLSTIVKRINRRGGLTDSDIDVAELTDLVLGYPITNQYNAVDCIRPLAGCYFFKGSEYDGKIHFHKDGADADLVVDPQDFINGEDEDDQDKRGQAKEYPRLLTGSYLDPTLDFAIGKTKAQRRSPDVRAIGEASLQIPVVMSPDEAMQATDKALKIMWSKLQGSRKFSLPYGSGSSNYLKMVPCIPFGLEGKRYVADQITLDDGQMLIECSYDRQSAYRSNVTAIPTLPPTPPVSTISGPTMFAALNLPALRTKDNTPGMYLAACGLRSSWPGCLVQISYDDGATFVDTVPITTASVMGLLTEHITDEGSGAEPVSVSIYGGELTNAAPTQLANGANGFAMPDANDVSEIAQFATQDETSPKRYDLTDVTRGRLGTDAVGHFAGDRFVMLQNVVFLPIDPRYAGRLLVFRPVSFGTDPALNATYDALFQPIIVGAEIVDFLQTESGQTITTETGEFLQVE